MMNLIYGSKTIYLAQMDILAKFLTENYEPFRFDVHHIYWMVSRNRYEILEKDGKILGVVFLSILNIQDRQYGCVSLICTDRNNRKQGIAKELIQRLCKDTNLSGAVFLTKHSLGREIRKYFVYICVYNEDASKAFGIPYQNLPSRNRYRSASIDTYRTIPNHVVPHILTYPNVMGVWSNFETEIPCAVRYFPFQLSDRIYQVGYLIYGGIADEYFDIGRHANVDALFVYSTSELSHPFYLHDTVSERALYRSDQDLKICTSLDARIY